MWQRLWHFLTSRLIWTRHECQWRPIKVRPTLRQREISFRPRRLWDETSVSVVSPEEASHVSALRHTRGTVRHILTRISAKRERHHSTKSTSISLCVRKIAIWEIALKLRLRKVIKWFLIKILPQFPQIFGYLGVSMYIEYMYVDAWNWVMVTYLYLSCKSTPTATVKETRDIE